MSSDSSSTRLAPRALAPDQSSQAPTPRDTSSETQALPAESIASPQVPSLSRPDAAKQYFTRHGVGMVSATFDVLAMVLVAVALHGEVITAVAFIATVLVVLYGSGFYRARASLSVLDDFPRLLGTVAIGAAVGLAINFATSIPLQSLWLFVAYLVALCIGRTLSYFVIHRARSKGYFQRRVAIVGTGVVADKLVTASASHPKYGFQVVGYVDDPKNTEVTRPDLLPVIGSPEDINATIADNKIDYVIVAFSGLPESELVKIIRAADRQSCAISIVERFFEVTSRRVGVDEVDGVPLVLLQRRAYRTLQWDLKRMLDIVVSGSALILLSPIMALIALISRIQDGPGVIFRQVRISVDGSEFEIMKFRSLRPADETESATKWNVKNDDRMSTFGKIIRKSSLDELPQLVNIIRGDMSLVGPRPERPHFVEEFGTLFRNYDDRHRVPSGLTGWAQIHGLRGDTSIADRARYDNYYIQNWSFWLDMKILMRTVFNLMKGSG